MVTALVVYASLHGSTAGLAGWIADELRAHGVDAYSVPAAHVRDVDTVDAVVIGSAVYIGRWMLDASDLVHHHAAALRSKPVWLFCSGPAGPPDETTHVNQQDRLARLIGARGCRVFGGALDRRTTGPVDAELGDFGPGDWRDEHAVRQWARDIAHDLTSLPLPTRAG